jgi:anti-sigma regulatory factor (Ser/Thr protein kinase)
MATSLLHRLATQPRRFAAAVCAGLAVLCSLHVLHPKPPVSRSVWVIAHDLPGGVPLTVQDVKAERLPLTLIPRGALLAQVRVVGRLVAAPMRAGEPVTDVRLLEPSLLVSELVTNAIVHGRSGAIVDAELVAGVLRVAVTDDSPAPLPEVDLHPRTSAEGGRGLLIVSLLASRWGINPASGGKAVWFELDA